MGSEDPCIVAERGTLNRCDVPARLPRVEEVEQRSRARPDKVLADSGFYRHENVRALEERGIEVYLPDPNLARELHTGKRARTIGRNRVRSPELKAMRKKLRSPAGRRGYERRKALVEPVFGVLRQQRNLRQFRSRGQDPSRGGVYAGGLALQFDSLVCPFRAGDQAGRIGSGTNLERPGVFLVESPGLVLTH